MVGYTYPTSAQAAPLICNRQRDRGNLKRPGRASFRIGSSLTAAISSAVIVAARSWVGWRSPTSAVSTTTPTPVTTAPTPIAAAPTPIAAAIAAAPVTTTTSVGAARIVP